MFCFDKTVRIMCKRDDRFKSEDRFYRRRRGGGWDACGIHSKVIFGAGMMHRSVHANTQWNKMVVTELLRPDLFLLFFVSAPPSLCFDSECCLSTTVSL